MAESLVTWCLIYNFQIIDHLWVWIRDNQKGWILSGEEGNFNPSERSWPWPLRRTYLFGCHSSPSFLEGRMWTKAMRGPGGRVEEGVWVL